MASRLQPLVDASQAVLTRLYRVRDEYASPGARPGFFKDPEYTTLRHAIVKGAMKRDAVQKVQPGWDKFSEPARASSVLNELENGYSVLKDVTRFRQIASDVLASSPGSMPLQTVLTSGQQLFLDLIAAYGKIMVLMSSLGSSDIRWLVGGYNAAHFLVHSRDDDDFVAVSAFVTRFVDDPLKEAALDLESSDAIRELVAGLLERHVAAWLAEPLSVTATWSGEWSGSAVTLCRERARAWLFWSLLISPGSLGCKSRSIELALKKTLSESFVCQVYRSVPLRLHDAFIELYSWYQPRRELDVSAKPKKLVAEAAAEAINSGAETHRGRRVLLAQRLKAMFAYVDDNPGVVGPALPSLLLTLSLSKDEVVWYFLHTPEVCAPPKAGQQGVIAGLVSGSEGSRYRADDWVDDEGLAELLFAHERLRRKIEKHWDLARDYHRELLVSPSGLLCEFKHPEELEDALDGGRLLQDPLGLHEAMLALQRIESTDANAVSKALLCSEILKGDANDPAALVRAACLSDVVFFPRFAKEAFDAALPTRFSLGSLFVLTWSQYALHPYANEEYALMRDKMGTMADDFLLRMQAELAVKLDSLLAEKMKLNAQTLPIRAAERLFAVRERKRAQKNKPGSAAEIAAGQQPTPLSPTPSKPETGLFRLDERAGFESKDPFNPLLDGLSQARGAVAGLAMALRGDGDNIVVWDRMLLPREFFRETMRAWLSKALSSSFLHGNDDSAVAILARARTVFDVCVHACDAARMDSTPLLRASYLTDVAADGGIAGSLGARLVAQLSSPDFVFSPTTRGMVRLGLRHGEAKWLLDMHQAKALAKLLGPKGMGAACRRILAHISTEAGRVRTLLGENEAPLRAFRDEGGIKLARGVKQCGEVASRTTTIGLGLCMVRILSDACYEPLLATLPGGSASLFGKAVSDEELRHCLVADSPTWALLPWSLSASAAVEGQANTWMGADFVLEVDAHANNAHCIATAVATLARLRGNRPALDEDFLFAWSSILLCMKPEQATSAFADLPIRGLIILAEKIVEESSSLDWTDLERYMPRAVIEAAVKDSAISKEKHSGNAAVDLANVGLGAIIGLISGGAVLGVNAVTGGGAKKQPSQAAGADKPSTGEEA